MDSRHTVKKEKQWPTELALFLRALVAFPEDLGSITSTHIHAGKIPINIIKKKKLFKSNAEKQVHTKKANNFLTKVVKEIQCS